MIDPTDFLSRIDRYREKTGAAEATASKHLFGDAKSIQRLRDGKLSIRVYQTGLKKLAELEKALAKERPDGKDLGTD